MVFSFQDHHQKDAHTIEISDSITMLVYPNHVVIFTFSILNVLPALAFAYPSEGVVKRRFVQRNDTQAPPLVRNTINGPQYSSIYPATAHGAVEAAAGAFLASSILSQALLSIFKQLDSGLVETNLTKLDGSWIVLTTNTITNTIPLSESWFYALNDAFHQLNETEVVANDSSAPAVGAYVARCLNAILHIPGYAETHTPCWPSGGIGPNYFTYLSNGSAVAYLDLDEGYSVALNPYCGPNLAPLSSLIGPKGDGLINSPSLNLTNPTEYGVMYNEPRQNVTYYQSAEAFLSSCQSVLVINDPA